ncbi:MULTISPECIES: GntR family transcriptional regulator [unclassified Chelatococcus]|uniref:GntR family transcriptional regulator n=1 Tax=unclassified Chelatococcus TaxID=2638111 RepID=UPI001BCD3FC3|nr:MULTISPECIES: GntR family transcriptional regulator [unclassified Chelatococcus]CAH1659559.1 GntR family transcriptional regulator [Hyphomicrobiales bacterium]MBS7740961.1 GntR family transcriptional regulator [Chelatococcus sp. HY11]MBX3546748.1 GntR family transcriptional regulator [Chelatococcus sp.]MCO5077781.1 GntR family transcriptional regulator [Chelatococcus sp.]CAH1683772.1 GntR family transcriptional regulator [Hyphomicrobiales bacterium]
MSEIVSTDREAGTLGEQLFHDIAEIIQSGELGLGSEVNEKFLAQRFQVSRGPVREALRRLQGIGLISREPFMRARVVSLNAKQLAELFQMREALEGMACRLAAENMSADESTRLLADLEADRRSWTSGDRSRKFDFHQRVVAACGNQRIIDTLNGDLHQLFRVYRRQSGMDNQRRQTAYQEHWQIMRAIISRDADLAESMMRSHIARASENLARQESFLTGTLEKSAAS